MDDVRRRARSYFDDAAPAHDWRHVERVATLAETLADRHPGSVDREVLALAVFLHDIGRAREDRGEVDDHATWGARRGGEILRDVGADEATVESVQHCVRAHRFSTGVEAETVEAKILSDADDLDALGAVGIARVFSYGGEIGESIHGPARHVAGDDSSAGHTQYDHFHEKILALPERMYTEEGRRLADERAAFVREYLERFEREVRGEM